MKYICPLIVVKDINISRKFYEELLNQKVKFDFGENVTFDGDFAIHLASHYAGLINNKEISSGGNDFELYFEEDKIEDITSFLKNNNVEFVHDIREEPWRQKVVRFYDPDRHIIEIGESLEHLARRLYNEGMNIEEICQTTFMPVEHVKSILIK